MFILSHEDERVISLALYTKGKTIKKQREVDVHRKSLAWLNIRK